MDLDSTKMEPPSFDFGPQLSVHRVTMDYDQDPTRTKFLRRLLEMEDAKQDKKKDKKKVPSTTLLHFTQSL